MNKQWFVIGRDGHVADNFINAWGPFDNETDARAFAIDTAMDNGWEEVKPEFDSEESVLGKTTDGKICNPYTK